MYSRFENNRMKAMAVIKKSAWSSILLSVIFLEFFIIDSFTGYFWIPGIVFLIMGIFLFKLNVNNRYEFNKSVRNFE